MWVYFGRSWKFFNARTFALLLTSVPCAVNFQIRVKDNAVVSWASPLHFLMGGKHFSAILLWLQIYYAFFFIWIQKFSQLSKATAWYVLFSRSTPHLNVTATASRRNFHLDTMKPSACLALSHQPLPRFSLYTVRCLYRILRFQA